jgi:hypothetical protein
VTAIFSVFAMIGTYIHCGYGQRVFDMKRTDNYAKYNVKTIIGGYGKTGI